MADRGFSFSGFLVRWVLALVLVFATYNPSGYSWYHWLVGAENIVDPLLALAAISLLIGWVIYLRATARSLGIIGTLLASALFATLVWSLIHYQLISINNTTLLAYIVLVILSAVMAIGLSWSHIRRRLSGQLDVDDRDED
ncbi:MAG: DUF6524 family protein [Sedimenticola sp.]|nr:DUF6524 family protein [Sedimenticola sp.]